MATIPAISVIPPAQDNRVRTMAVRINRLDHNRHREAAWDVIHVIGKAIDKIMQSRRYDGSVAEVRHEWAMPAGLSDEDANVLATAVICYLNALGYYCGVKKTAEESENISRGVELHVSWA